MQTQLNSFQQFVKDNQGHLIQFLHNSQRVSKVVADIQGEYFTGKSNASDAKIDSFYYFSDCTFFEEKHPLVEVLEKHNVSVLNLSIGHSCVFKYNHYCDYDNMVNGTCLTTSQPVGFHVDSIKEVWSIVDNKNTKVYPQTPSATPGQMDKLSSYFEAQNKVLNDCEKVKNALENNKEVAIYTIDGCTYKKFNFNSIVNDVVVGIYKGKTVNIPIKNIGNINSNFGSLLYLKDFKELSFKEPSSTPGPMDKLASYFEAQNNVKNACEKVNNTLEKLNNSFDKVFKSIDKEDINYKYPGILSGRAYTRYPSGKVKTDTFYKDGKFHGDYTEYHENGNIKTKAFYKDGKISGDYYEYFNDGSCSKFIEYKNGLKNGVYIEYGRNDKGFQISVHKYFKDDVEVTV
jgi:antitoxin component YwqK of YwqJK toxin-antitoxin module